MRQVPLIIICLVLLVTGSYCSRPPSTATPQGIDETVRTATITPSPSLSPTTATATAQLTTPFTPTLTTTPTVTENTIVINAGYITEPELLAVWQGWAQTLSMTSGLDVVAHPGPATQWETLQMLNRGDIDISFVSPLAYLLGRERGWIDSIAMIGTEPTPLMFIARSDSELTPGEPAEVFQQLTGKRPCWPAQVQMTPPPQVEYVSLFSYILPQGLLALNSVETAMPVFLEGEFALNSIQIGVFRGQCDFAAIPAVPPEEYKNRKPGELNDVSFERWAQEMQILYTTPPIGPGDALVFSSQLPDPVRDQLASVFLANPGPSRDTELLPFDEGVYEEFGRIVDASGLDIQPYLTWSPWLELEEEAITSQGMPGGWVTPPADTIVIDVWLGGELPFLPGQSSRFLNMLVLPAIYAELVRRDADGNYFPYLVAELPTLENGLVRFVGEGEDEQLAVEFRLRPGTQWQDGQPLTAEDLVFSWNLVMDPEWSGNHLRQTGLAPEVYVNTVEALGPERIVFYFMSQRQAREATVTGGRLGNPSLYSDLAQQVGPVVPLDYLDVGNNVFPRHLLAGIPAGEIADSPFASRPVYAGAYRLVEGGGDGQPVVLEAFADFILGEPAIQRIVFGSNYYSVAAEPYWQSPELLALAMPAGAIQAQLALPAVRTREGEEPAAYDALPGTAWVPRDSWAVLDFNLDNPHLADLRVRRAIAHAIDRQAIIDLALAGHGMLMRSYLPAWHPLYAGDDSLPAYAYDPAQARALLQEAGYDLTQTPAVHPTHGALVLRLASMDVASYPRTGTALLIQEQLAAIGIQLDVQFYEWLEFEGEDCTAIRNGRHFDLAMAAWLGGGLYPLRYLEQVTASWSIPAEENGCPLDHANWSGWRNARVDELVTLLKDGRLALEQPEDYRRLWTEHQQLWVEELPSLSLFNWQRPVVIAPELLGVQPSPFAFDGIEDTWNIFRWSYNNR